MTVKNRCRGWIEQLGYVFLIENESEGVDIASALLAWQI